MVSYVQQRSWKQENSEAQLNERAKFRKCVKLELVFKKVPVKWVHKKRTREESYIS